MRKYLEIYKKHIFSLQLLQKLKQVTKFEHFFVLHTHQKIGKIDEQSYINDELKNFLNQSTFYSKTRTSTCMIYLLLTTCCTLSVI